MKLNRTIAVNIDAAGATAGARRATDALREVDEQARRTGGGLGALERGGGQASSSLSALASSARMLGPAMAGISVFAFTKSIFDAGLAVDSLNRSFTAIFGDAQLAAQELAFVRSESDRLGQSFYVLAPQFKQISAAAKGTSLEGEAIHKVFSAITEASTALGMTADNTSGALNALSQMISKGNVQAEELRGQLGERLPGAFQIAARSMGVTTQELNKMLEQGEVAAADLLPKLADELHKMYGAAAETSGMESAQAAVNKLSQSWKDLLAALYNADLAVDILNGISGALQLTKGAVEAVLGPLGDLYRAIDNIDEAISRLGQGRMKFTDFAGMNASDLRASLANTRQNLEKEMDTLQSKIRYQEQIARNLGSISSGAKAKADAYRKTYAELEGQLLKYEAAELATANEILTRTRTVAEEKVKITQAEKDRLKKILDDELQTERQKLDKQVEQMRAAGLAEVEIAQFKAKRIAEINDKAAKESLAREKKLEAEKEAARKARAKLEPYQVSEFERLNRGDMFFGLEDANKRGLDLLNDVYKRNDELLTEFTDKHREVVVGETEFKIEQLNLQAEAYKRAGADELAVEQWVKAEKRRLATDWLSGTLRALDEISTGGQDAAQAMEDAVSGAFQAMTDAITEFAMTGKMSFSDFADSVIRDLMRIVIQQQILGPLAGAAGGFLSGLFSGPSSAAGSASRGFNFAGEMSSFFSRNAKGNVYQSPSLSAYSGGVYDSPQLFAFAQGGVFGEAGPEAIMPLSRDSSGSLGVKAIGGGGMKLVVNIIESQGKGGQAEQRQEDGVSIVDLFFDQIDAKMAQNVNQGRGQTTAALTKTFGLNRSRGALR
jgi:lambda family phage tail tape measure protein